MVTRPSVVAFDIIETTFSLESLRKRMVASGFPAVALDLWFARLLRDAFALAATGVYASFRDIASDQLQPLALAYGLAPDPTRDEALLAGFASLDPHPDAPAALRKLQETGLRTIALSNGAAETTQKLLDRSGLSSLVDDVVSVAQIQKWKPLPDVYQHAAARAGTVPGDLALVATHAWDVHGAKRAGLITGFVARGQPFPRTMAQPDAIGETLMDVVEQLIGFPESSRS